MTNKQWETWDQATILAFQEQFLTWYHKEKRPLPWRMNTEPYRIWISEIMLQQTRVDTVIGYYYRFMEQFPTIEALALAPEDALLKTWEGLGYYSRARNLKAAAQQILTLYAGKFPQDIEAIRSLKGIGPYTAGAIASIAFQQPEPAIDGNVMRVVSRLFQIDADIAKASNRKFFDAAMRTIISHDEPGEFNQAMMDLGSAICRPLSPQCELCPIQPFCAAEKSHTVAQYPVKTKKAKPKDCYYVAYIIENEQQEYLLTQRQEAKLLANMWLFPMAEVGKEVFEEIQNAVAISSDFLARHQLAVEKSQSLVFQKKPVGEITHIFTHLKWHVLVLYSRTTTQKTQALAGKWIKEADFDQFVFPKPQQKMVDLWKNANAVQEITLF